MSEEQKPVAWMHIFSDGHTHCVTKDESGFVDNLTGTYKTVPLYTAPPNCPNCEYHKKRAQIWRHQAYKLGGKPLPWEPNMTDLRKAAVMALEFVDWLCGDDHSVKPKNNALKTREALRQALAESANSTTDFVEPKALSQTEQKMRIEGSGTLTTKPYPDCYESEQEFRQALAQPEQEPVVHPVVHLWDCICNWAEMIANDGKDANLSPPDWLVDAVKLATAPSKREWVGLTDEERADCWSSSAVQSAINIEAKLKEKNGG